MAEELVTRSSVEHWLQVIATYDREFKKWETRVDKILKKYRDDRGPSQRGGEAKFNILWSNVNTIVPAVYARLPKPDVSRRFRDNDPVGRVASLILERALEFEIEHYPDYRAALKNGVQDRFLGGRGVAWVRYEPHFHAVQSGMPEDGLQITEDADESQSQESEELDYECAPVDYVHWRDFGHSVARTWEEVTSVWRKVYMGRNALIERFGEEIGGRVPLDTRPEDLKKTTGGGDGENIYQALIYEIWDKESNKAIWLSKSLGEVIDERDDPLELENFFPCPRPLFATLTTDSLVPTPDFILYQDQARELDTLCDRIDGLIRALQVRGIYDAAVPELARLFSEASNGEMIPVKNWQAFAEKQGLKGAIDLVDLTPIASALVEAYKAMDQVKGQIFEITGLSDIIRGDTEASETATAQRLKGQFGSLRLKSMQSDVSQFAQDILQIKAQIMCKHFQPQTLLQISAATQLSAQDQALIPQAIQLLSNQPLRNFRIEVAADSMVQIDEIQDKKDRLEFLTATSTFLQKAVPAVEASPQIAPLLLDMLKYGVTAFKVGKSIEGQFDETADKLKQMAANPQPKPNPEVMKMQAQAQLESAKVQAQLQGKQTELQMQDQFNERQAQREMQLEQWKQTMQAQQNQHQNELEAQRAALQAQHDAQLEQLRLAMEGRQSQLEQQVQVLIAKMNNEAKIEVAEIAANTSIESAQISAANQASEAE